LSDRISCSDTTWPDNAAICFLCFVDYRQPRLDAAKGFGGLGRRLFQSFSQSSVESLDAFGQHFLEFRLASNSLREAAGDFVLRCRERIQPRRHGFRDFALPAQCDEDRRQRCRKCSNHKHDNEKFHSTRPGDATTAALTRKRPSPISKPWPFAPSLPRPIRASKRSRRSSGRCGHPPLIDDMFESMYAADGIGLAAIQIGVPKRVLVMDLAQKEGEKRAARLHQSEDPLGVGRAGDCRGRLPLGSGHLGRCGAAGQNPR
jgi:hypothetical protein